MYHTVVLRFPIARPILLKLVCAALTFKGIVKPVESPSVVAQHARLMTARIVVWSSGEAVSGLTDLIAQVKIKTHELGVDLEREFKVLSSRLAFGLNFERHRPEAVELPQRPVRKGDKVRILPARGSISKADERLWIAKNR
jgi:hypothetical protein